MGGQGRAAQASTGTLREWKARSRAARLSTQVSWRRRPSARGPVCGWSHPTFPAALLSQVRVAGFRAARRRSGHTVNVHVQRRPGGPAAETGGSRRCEYPAQIPLGPVFPSSSIARREPGALCEQRPEVGPVVASLLPFSRIEAPPPHCCCRKSLSGSRPTEVPLARWASPGWGAPLPRGAECPRRSSGPRVTGRSSPTWFHGGRGSRAQPVSTKWGITGCNEATNHLPVFLGCSSDCLPGQCPESTPATHRFTPLILRLEG